jgi:hypothetical protein
MIWVVHPGSGSWDPNPDFLPIPSRDEKGTFLLVFLSFFFRHRKKLSGFLDPCNFGGFFPVQRRL